MGRPEQPYCIKSPYPVTRKGYPVRPRNNFQDLFTWFSTPQDLDENAKKNAYAMGLVFHEVNNESLSYSLRFNRTRVPKTKKPHVDKYGRSPIFLTAFSLFKYFWSGFLGWQNALDQTFLHRINGTLAKDLKIGLMQFPFPPYNNDLFWTVVKRLVEFFFIILRLCFVWGNQKGCLLSCVPACLCLFVWFCLAWTGRYSHPA